MQEKKDKGKITRRKFLAGLAVCTSALALPIGGANASTWEEYFRQHFKRLDKDELDTILKNMEKELSEKYRKAVTVKATPPMENVVFGYALDLSRCIGCRRCVYACVKENNLSRTPQIHWINVLEFEKGNKKWQYLEHSNRYYNPEDVPQKGHFYVPVQCQQCKKPPCIKVCPVKATWQEPDGIVVVDYNWCIGCRFCMAACPYGARSFNWAKPYIPKEEFNPSMHYLGNRPQYKGVVGKCTFCIQRSREGRYTACVEACPVGARKFGNLLDPKSEIRYILEQLTVFRLKEGLDTNPKFFYFFSMGSPVKS
ncbi:MAG: 4Fe-4S dicluster domain-containing protein [Thermodesulfovibrionia bacterium]|nr:4Fe-4S dicluster domain-containing protein [Thermodesulfovibrionia bacterium]